MKQIREIHDVFNQNTGVLKMSKQRVKDAKYNTRSFPPQLDVNDDKLGSYACRCQPPTSHFFYEEIRIIRQVFC